MKPITRKDPKLQDVPQHQPLLNEQKVSLKLHQNLFAYKLQFISLRFVVENFLPDCKYIWLGTYSILQIYVR